MKNNTNLFKNNTLFYINFCFQVFHITADPKLWVLVLQLYKPSFETSLVSLLYYCRLGNERLHKVWRKSIVISQNLLHRHLLSEKLSLTTNTPYFLYAGHCVAVYANYSNSLYLKIVNTFSVSLSLQSLLYLHSWYARCIASFNNFSLLTLHYLICSRTLSTGAAKPISSMKSLFLINVKKL